MLLSSEKKREKFLDGMARELREVFVDSDSDYMDVD